MVTGHFRRENCRGTSRSKTMVSLAKLPKYIVKLVEERLKPGDTSALEEYVPLRAIGYPGAVVVGLTVVVLTVLTQLGICEVFGGVASRAAGGGPSYRDGTSDRAEAAVGGGAG